MDPERVVKQLAVFESDPTVDIVYTALRLIDLENNPIGEMHGQEIPPENFLAQLLFRNVIPGPSTIMAKRNCLAHNPYNEAFVHAEDYELMTRLAHHYRFKYDIPSQTIVAMDKIFQRFGRVIGRIKVISNIQPTIETIVDRTNLNQEDKSF